MKNLDNNASSMNHAASTTAPVLLHNYSFWKTLKGIFTKPCYAYEIVYKDGLRSFFVEDSEGREAYGITIGNYILPIHGEDVEIPLRDAKESRAVPFTGLRTALPSLEVVRYIHQHLGNINTLLQKLGGTPLKRGLYASERKDGKYHFGLSFRSGSSHIFYIEDSDPVLNRPMVALY